MTSKRAADDRFGSLAEILNPSTKFPLYPRKRNSPKTVAMSAKCQKATSYLFDHFIRTGVEGRGATAGLMSAQPLTAVQKRTSPEVAEGP
jgi:hypothetical protein